MNTILLYTLLGCISGGIYYIMMSLEGGGLNPEVFMKCIMAAGIGGLIPGAIKQSIRHFVPIVQSWLMVLVIVYGFHLFDAKVANLFWNAFIYGYLAHLLWEGYRKNLPKF